MIDVILKLADLYEDTIEDDIDLSAKFGDLYINLKNILPEININRNTFKDWINQNTTVLNQVKNIKWLDAGDYLISFSKMSEPKYILSKPNFEMNGIKELISTFIPKYKGFPAMKLLKCLVEKENQPNLNYNNDLAHNDWFLKAVRMIDQSYTLEELMPMVKDYLNANRPLINNIRKHFEYQPKFLGSGIDGAAFDVGQNIVLKIFSSSKSYQAAKETMDKLHQNKDFARTEAMIYDVQQLPKFNGFNLYYYLMEKMIPIDKLDSSTYQNVRIIIGKAYNIINNANHTKVVELRTSMNVDDITKFIKEIIIKIKQLIIDEYSVKFLKNIKRDNITLKDNWFDLLVEEITMKLITSRNDLHGGNLGLTNFGEFRFYDSIV